MRKFLMIVLSILVIIAIVTTVITALYLLILSGGIFSFMPNPPEPEITYGEFPFRVTYELNGEYKEISDIIICEFDGFENRGSGGKRYKWKSHLKSGKERMTLLEINETSELYCWEGSPEYYMDDLRYETKEEYEQYRESHFEEYFITYGEWENGVFKSVSISLEEALEKYGLKIIEVHYPNPITQKDTTTARQGDSSIVSDKN